MPWYCSWLQVPAELVCLPTHRHSASGGQSWTQGRRGLLSSSREQGPCRTICLCAGQCSSAETQTRVRKGPAREPVLLVTIIQITGPMLLLARRTLRITQAAGALLHSFSQGSNAVQICRSCTVTPEVTSEYRQHLSSGRL